jgi:hypothetical protein
MGNYYIERIRLGCVKFSILKILKLTSLNVFKHSNVVRNINL